MDMPFSIICLIKVTDLIKKRKTDLVMRGEIVIFIVNLYLYQTMLYMPINSIFNSVPRTSLSTLISAIASKIWLALMISSFESIENTNFFISSSPLTCFHYDMLENLTMLEVCKRI